MNIKIAKMKTINYKRKEKLFNTKRTELLLKLINEGRTTKEIAEQLKISQNIIRAKIAALDIDMRQAGMNATTFNPNIKYKRGENDYRIWSKVEDAFLESSLLNGLLNKDEVSIIMGRSKGSISARRQTLGLKERFAYTTNPTEPMYHRTKEGIKKTSNIQFPKLDVYDGKWTPKEDKELRKLINAGKNGDQLATALRRTRQEIRARKITLGIKKRITRTNNPKSLIAHNGSICTERSTGNWTRQERVRLMNFVKTGKKSINEIATKMGRSRDSIVSQLTWIKNHPESLHKANRYYSQWDKKSTDILIREYRKGKSSREISEFLNMKQPRIVNRIYTLQKRGIIPKRENLNS